MRNVIIFLFCALFQMTTLSAKIVPEYDLALCAIFQNEADYLREWIEFHKLVGVQHFYLYNNVSTDHYMQVLLPYIETGEVELFDWNYVLRDDGSRNWTKTQVSAYNHALLLAKKKANWLAVLDTDEFLFPVEEYSLSEFLLNYRDASALCVNWQMYGTSGVPEILPGQLLIEELIYKAPTDYGENVHVKCIVRPRFIKQFENPHYPVLNPGFYQVNSNKEPCHGPFANIVVDKIRINHYWTRDEKFFREFKVPRRETWKDGASYIRANNINVEVDTAIYKYLPELRERLY